MPIPMKRTVAGCDLRRTIAGWVWHSWTFRQERDERGRMVWWARDSRLHGVRDSFPCLTTACDFARATDREKLYRLIDRWHPSADELQQLHGYLNGPRTCERFDVLPGSVRAMINEVTR